MKCHRSVMYLRKKPPLFSTDFWHRRVNWATCHHIAQVHCIALFCRQVKTPALIPPGPDTALALAHESNPATHPGALWPSCSHNVLWAWIGLLTCLGSRVKRIITMTTREKRKGREGVIHRAVFVRCCELMLSCVNVCFQLPTNKSLYIRRCVRLLFIRLFDFFYQFSFSSFPMHSSVPYSPNVQRSHEGSFSLSFVLFPSPLCPDFAYLCFWSMFVLSAQYWASEGRMFTLGLIVSF